jgi:AcrR family transcriptional regulator
MNKAQPSRKRRSYDNSLRQEHANQTRERILDSAVKVIEAGGWRATSLASVARAAGVSEPTLYRHFGSRERLLEELEARGQEKLGFPAFPQNAEELVHHVHGLFGKFEQHEAYIRASRLSGLGKEMRARGKAGRLRRMQALVAALLPNLDKREADQLTGVIRVLASWEAFDTLTRELGLTSQEASQAVSSAIEMLLGNQSSGTRKRNSRGRPSNKRITKRTSATEKGA